MEFIIAIIIDVPFVLFALFLLYRLIFRNKHYNKDLAKAKLLYPEFYQLREKRHSTWEAVLKEKNIWRSAEQEINDKIKELPYTPLEEQYDKIIEIEDLKKTRAIHKSIATKYQQQLEAINKEIDKSIDDSKLLHKIYKGFWYN